jgi:antitoxin ParD1/3/4
MALLRNNIRAWNSWRSIPREQERSAEIEAARAALIEGEASGEAKPFDAGAFKRRMLASNG